MRLQREEGEGSVWQKVSVVSKRPNHRNCCQHCESEWHSALIRPPPTWGGKVLPKPKQSGLSSHGKCLLLFAFVNPFPPAQTHLHSLLCSAASQACPAATESCCHKPVSDNKLNTTTTTTTNRSQFIIMTLLTTLNCLLFLHTNKNPYGFSKGSAKEESAMHS